jgi:CheY-like chemotaxis protein
MVKQFYLVEDESAVALDINHILESSGYEVPFVTSRGEDAVKEAAKIRPDLVLMDITLKGTMDGIEAAKKNYNPKHTCCLSDWGQ